MKMQLMGDGKYLFTSLRRIKQMEILVSGNFCHSKDYKKKEKYVITDGTLATLFFFN
jgi:hypothetical protein